jgi:hypothetical protein
MLALKNARYQLIRTPAVCAWALPWPEMLPSLTRLSQDLLKSLQTRSRIGQTSAASFRI